MARGWESKSIEEAQQEMAAERSTHKQPRQNEMQMEIEKKRDSLQLQRTRVLREIEGCRNDRVRTTLGNGLAYLDAELAKLLPIKDPE